MGSAFSSWEGVTGAIYPGAGSEAMWLYVAIGICVVALLFGLMHEKAAYRRSTREANELK